MTFKEYYRSLTKLVEKNPEIMNYKVVYAIDDEGNAFHDVIAAGTIGEFNSDTEEFTDETKSPNSVCIN